MKKILSLLLFVVFVSPTAVFAEEAINQAGTTVKEPVWEEYVAPKFQNPRTDFNGGGKVAELVVGIILTDLIITAPIGIPMIVHSSTKIKMNKMAGRKELFDREIAKARLIEDDNQKAQEYQRILRECHLKEKTKKHYANKNLKKQKKEQKKAEKQTRKLKTKETPIEITAE